MKVLDTLVGCRQPGHTTHAAIVPRWVCFVLAQLNFCCFVLQFSARFMPSAMSRLEDSVLDNVLSHSQTWNGNSGLTCCHPHAIIEPLRRSQSLPTDRRPTIAGRSQLSKRSCLRGNTGITPVLRKTVSWGDCDVVFFPAATAKPNLLTRLLTCLPIRSRKNKVCKVQRG